MKFWVLWYVDISINKHYQKFRSQIYFLKELSKQVDKLWKELCNILYQNILPCSNNFNVSRRASIWKKNKFTLGDLKTRHPQSGLILIQDILMSGFWMVKYVTKRLNHLKSGLDQDSNGRKFSHYQMFLFIWIPD